MGFGNLALLFGQCDSGVGMTHFPQPNPTHRANRVKLATTPVLVKLGDGKQAKGNIHVVSVNGGLLPVGYHFRPGRWAIAIGWLSRTMGAFAASMTR